MNHIFQIAERTVKASIPISINNQELTVYEDEAFMFWNLDTGYCYRRHEWI